MKKGFTMIELIFVIVILGILASVAIPRLASTRSDAEISAATGNIRTILSDISAYSVVKGDLTGDELFSAVTNVAVGDKTVSISTGSTLKVGGEADCITITYHPKATTTGAGGATTTTPAYISIAGKANPTGTCQTVLQSRAVQDFTNSQIEGVQHTAGTGEIAIGSNTSVYDQTTTTN